MAWKPLQRAKAIYDEKRLAGLIREFTARGYSEEMIRKLYAEAEEAEWWINLDVVVTVRRFPDRSAHVSIRRQDRKPIHDWRIFQRIKNEVLGPECEAVELYPAESRLADSANQYHLWGSSDPTFRFPIGFPDRLVMEVGDPDSGAVQRPLDH